MCQHISLTFLKYFLRGDFMKKKLALALMLSAAVFSQAAEEKPEVVFTGTPWSTMGISGAQ